MDNTFQELDYSDISAKNLNKRKRYNDINSKTRGGIIRLGSLILLVIIIIYLFFTNLSKSKIYTKKEEELISLKESKLLYEKRKIELEGKSNSLVNEMLEANINSDKLSKQKNELNENIKKIQESNIQSEKELNNRKAVISDLENKLNTFIEYKKKVDDMQKLVESLEEMIDKLKKE